MASSRAGETGRLKAFLFEERVVEETASGKTVAELVAEVEKAVRPLGFKIRRAADSRDQPGIAEMEITLVAKQAKES